MKSRFHIFITSLAILSAATASAQSRKIRFEDLSSAPVTSVPVAPAATTGAASTAGASLIATPGANYLPQTTAAAPITYPVAPPPDASLPVLQAAIQSFMQFMAQPSTQANLGAYPDYVNPAVVARQSTAPSVDPTPLKDCSALPAAAKEKMRGYLQRCGPNLRIPNGNVAIIDFSTSRPVLYVLRQSDLSCVQAVHIGYGVGSHGNPPRAGNTPESHMSPPGFHITKVHNGSAYQEFNSIGIMGMGRDNSNTAGRGVILHPSNGHTHGCIGIPWARFAEIKKQLGYGTVVYNYFPSQSNGDSEFRCPAYRTRSARSTPPRSADSGAMADDATGVN